MNAGFEDLSHGDIFKLRGTLNEGEGGRNLLSLQLPAFILRLKRTEVWGQQLEFPA